LISWSIEDFFSVISSSCVMIEREIDRLVITYMASIETSGNARLLLNFLWHLVGGGVTTLKAEKDQV